MAAANESQGLKIAVAAFVTLTVILAVSSYFLYSAYAGAEAKMEEQAKKASDAESKSRIALGQVEELRKYIGTRAEEFDAAKTEVGTHFTNIQKRIDNLAAAITAAINKAQAAGATGPELEEAKAKIQTIVASYRNEPNKNYISTLDRMAELMESVALESSEIAFDYVALRHSLESSTTVAKQQIDVQTKAAVDSKTDLDAEHTKHEQERQSLLTKVDQLQTDNENKATQIANLTTQLRQNEEDARKKLELANSIVREQRDQLEKQENVLDKPDGYVTFVDEERHEAHINVTRRMGARPQMKMTIFGAGSPGVPTESPKGSIELLQVGDKFSIARITKTNSHINPIRVGDIVYSAAWSPNEPMRFALIGKMDVNRDGKDDRVDLKRLIEEAGGIVDYDLPPPEYGKETGKLTARIAWYVVDERMPFRELFQQKSDVTLSMQSQFEKRRGEAIKEARLAGIRPMPIGRLLAYLGYEMSAPTLGRAEAIDNTALRRLTEPKQQQQKTTQPRPAPDASKNEAPAPEEESAPPK